MNCCRCGKTIDMDTVAQVIGEESPPDQFDRPMESYTEDEQAFREGKMCPECYEGRDL
jgi:hypothetical protein